MEDPEYKRLVCAIEKSITPEIFQYSQITKLTPNRFINQCLRGIVDMIKANTQLQHPLVLSARRALGNDKSEAERKIESLVAKLFPEMAKSLQHKKTVNIQKFIEVLINSEEPISESLIRRAKKLAGEAALKTK